MICLFPKKIEETRNLVIYLWFVFGFGLNSPRPAPHNLYSPPCIYSPLTVPLCNTLFMGWEFSTCRSAGRGQKGQKSAPPRLALCTPLASSKGVSWCFSSWVDFSSGNVNPLAWLSESQVCSEMDKRFSVESKAFAFSVVDGASVLRVVEKRIFFLARSSWVPSAPSGLHRHLKCCWLYQKSKILSSLFGKDRKSFFFFFDK